MLPPRSSLPYREFRTFGRLKIETPFFSVRAKNNSLKEDRFGVVIGTHSVKNATRRNFWRRQAKSVFLSVTQKKQPTKNQKIDILVVFRAHHTPLRKNVFKNALSDAIISLISRA